MLIEVKVPQLSESVSEATLLAWHKKQGEAVKRDENLIDIETDKVVLELPAPADGVLVSILKGDKGTVVAGEVIAKIDTDGKASAVSAPKAKQRRKSRSPDPLPPLRQSLPPRKRSPPRRESIPARCRAREETGGLPRAMFFPNPKKRRFRRRPCNSLRRR
jgi:2-oxoglutarate dehydrogenase E2 component (dihydrolipoamide succinyltransferase)